MNRYKATIILIIVTLGYLLSCPFHNTFIGGLISSGFCASMIGGFADWYGITALFRKPLGIPYKTEIIPKNREKIFDGLSSMVSEELLSKEYLIKLVDEYNTITLIKKFIANNNSKENIKTVSNILIEEFLTRIKSNDLGNVSASVIINNLKQISLSRLIISMADISIENGYDNKIINFLLGETELFIKTEDFKSIILKLVDETKASYENGMARRKIVNTVVLDIMLNYPSEKIASVVTNKLEEYIKNLSKFDNQDRVKLENWLYVRLEQFKQNKAMQEKVEQFKIQQINKSVFLKYLIGSINELKNNEIKDEGIVNKLYELAEKYIEDFYVQINIDETLQQKVDEYLKLVLSKLIQSGHENIGKLVRENLNKYSDEMLVELIESKAGNDLQLIRINGSVVGGLVGVLLFLLTYSI